ncbi:hypothetical protein Dimus_016962 [Dionaea muscipula]
MNSSTYLVLLLFSLLLGSSSYSLADDPLGYLCRDISSTPVDANIDHLLSQIVEKTKDSYFAAISYGKGPTQVYGLAQCREDVDTSDCSNCIQNATQEIRPTCKSQVDARIWYDFCFLRYSTENFIGKLDTTASTLYRNVESVTDPDTFNKVLAKLFHKVDSEAVKPGNHGLGKGQTKLPDPFETLYALAQCTGDLSQLSCAQCLATANVNFEGFCKNSKGCRVLYSSCYVRYELYPFYFPLKSTTKEPDTITTVLVRP